MLDVVEIEAGVEHGALALPVAIKDVRRVADDDVGFCGGLVCGRRSGGAYGTQALARQLTQGAIDPFGTLPAVVLEPQLESELGDAVIQTSDGAYLGLDPGRAELIVRAIRDEVEASLLRLLKSLKGRDETQLFTFGTNQPDGADTDLLVDARTALLRSLTIKMSNNRSP